MRNTLRSLALSLLCGCLPPPAPRPLFGEPPPPPPQQQAAAPRVVVTDTHLVLNQAIFFEFDQARILPVSYPILDEVARALKEHPTIARVRIEGHTDNRGTPSYNLNLSQRRADAVVQYLVHKGVEHPRLQSVGFGLSQPIAGNGTEEGRAQNRRVGFVIEEWREPRRMLKAQR